MNITSACNTLERIYSIGNNNYYHRSPVKLYVYIKVHFTVKDFLKRDSNSRSEVYREVSKFEKRRTESSRKTEKQYNGLYN